MVFEFAHGVRLFATVYNDMIHPQDPYDFLEIILPEHMKSLERNERMEQASHYLLAHPQSIDNNGKINDDYLQREIDQITKDLGTIDRMVEISDENRYLIITMLQEMSKTKNKSAQTSKSTQREKAAAFITALKFPEYTPKVKENHHIEQERKIINARQLRGQPAGKGIVRGKARVISSTEDIF